MTTTGFEQRVADPEQNNDWTSVAEESAYLAALVASSHRVAVAVAGQSVEGRDLRVVTVAHPSARTSARPAVLIVGAQHGDEGSGREGLLQMIREWATTTDYETVAYLSRVRLVCIPTANPDRLRIWDNGTRENAAAVDLNRDHYAVTQPESAVIQRAITDLRPVMIVDLHDHGSGTGGRCGYQTSRHPQASADILRLGAALVDELLAAAPSNGFASYIFTGASPVEPTLRTQGALRHAVTLLAEADRNPTPDLFPRVERVEMHKATLRHVVRFHAARWDEINGAAMASRVSAQIDGTNGGRPFNFANGVRTLSIPSGYSLSAAQVTSNARLLAAMGWQTMLDGDATIVPTAQLDQRLIPFVFDARATERAVAATAATVPPTAHTTGLQRDGRRAAVAVAQPYWEAGAIVPAKV